MKHILWITTFALVIGQYTPSLAQTPGEPGPEPPAPAAGAVPAAPATVPTRGSRKVTAGFSAGVAVSSGAPGGLNTYFTTGSRGDSIPPVIIRFSQIDAKASQTLEEDLFVMARVISRTLERAETDKVSYKLGVPMLLTGSGRSVRPMYIEGLGPLFMIKVNFALLPPLKAEKRKEVPETETEWNTAHREVFGAAESEPADEPAGRASRYNEDQVELLKKELVGALKNAANIRDLKKDEFVNVAVFGHASGPRGKSLFAPGGSAQLAVRMLGNLPADQFDWSNANKGSVLTLRARKSDIDAFAAGKLESEQFREKVEMTTYFGSGRSITSINSWIQENAGQFQVP